MQAFKATVAILASLMGPSFALAATPASEKCELHVSATGQSAAQVWRTSRAPGDPELPNTIAWRLETALNAQTQIDVFKKVDLEKYYPNTHYDIHYQGSMNIEEYRLLIKSKRRAFPSTAACYIDLIFAGNGYVDMTFGSRRLHSAITVRKFNGEILRKTDRGMIDPLNYVDDHYFAGNVAGIDKEIQDSFYNNVAEFSVEIQP